MVYRGAGRDRRDGEVIASPEGVPPGGRNDALNHGAWTLGRWIVAGAFELADVEDALCA
jgi:hypothetical protein